MNNSSTFHSGALFSPCGKWRYKLWRRWGLGSKLVVIGLNPSTADETRNDPTVTRCIGYARQWNFDGLVMLNIFAYRATDPKVMKMAADPVGPTNLRHILNECRIAKITNSAVLAAWGTHGAFNKHSILMRLLIERANVGVACLGLTRSGEPKHPLYLPKNATPIPFIGDGGRLCRTMPAVIVERVMRPPMVIEE